MTDNGAPNNWKTQMRKGFLDLCILNYLDAHEWYGYDLVQELRQVEGTTMRESIIYPLLARLQDDGLVISEKRPSTAGPPRKYYQITEPGRRVLQEMNAHWHGLVAAMETAMQFGKEQRHERTGP